MYDRSPGSASFMRKYALVRTVSVKCSFSAKVNENVIRSACDRAEHARWDGGGGAGCEWAHDAPVAAPAAR